MILGIGIDIVEVARIRSSHERFGERFLERILRPEEIQYCLLHRDPGPYLAARFAAKEAVSKAFGTGIGRHLGWKDIEIQRRESGEPILILHGPGLELINSRGPAKVHISLSHTLAHATAMAVLEKL
jgi:holo-[acyl-carrier protein] synthase